MSILDVSFGFYLVTQNYIRSYFSNDCSKVPGETLIGGLLKKKERDSRFSRHHTSTVCVTSELEDGPEFTWRAEPEVH